MERVWTERSLGKIVRNAENDREKRKEDEEAGTDNGGYEGGERNGEEGSKRGRVVKGSVEDRGEKDEEENFLC